MPSNGYHENDIVRVTRDIRDKNPYTGELNAVSAGDAGTVVRGFPGDASYDVEFTFWKSDTEWSTAILIIAATDLEPVPETATV